MSDIDKYQPPSNSFLDRLHAMARGGLGAIPLVGSLATEIFNCLIAPPIEGRRNRWMDEVADRLKKLDEAGQLRIEDLQGNEVFITIVMQASQAAMRNHQQEKHDALRNAVLNSALPNPPEESLQQMFVAWVDSFTVWHLRILHFFKNPEQWFLENGKRPPGSSYSSSISQVLECAFPEIVGQSEMIKIIMGELEVRGLYAGGGLSVMMTPSGALQPRVTKMGHLFMSYISERK